MTFMKAHFLMDEQVVGMPLLVKSGVEYTRLAVVALILSAEKARPGPLRRICLVLWRHLGLRVGRAGGGQFVNSCLF